MSTAGLVTILFSDLVGSTALSQDMGGAAADNVRRASRTAIGSARRWSKPRDCALQPTAARSDVRGPHPGAVGGDAPRTPRGPHDATRAKELAQLALATAEELGLGRVAELSRRVLG